jgi:hypothetical protein
MSRFHGTRYTCDICKKELLVGKYDGVIDAMTKHLVSDWLSIRIAGIPGGYRLREAHPRARARHVCSDHCARLALIRLANEFPAGDSDCTCPPYCGTGEITPLCPACRQRAERTAES